MKFQVEPIAEHQPVAATALAAEWAEEMQQAKGNADKVGIEPRPDEGV